MSNTTRKESRELLLQSAHDAAEMFVVFWEKAALSWAQWRAQTGIDDPELDTIREIVRLGRDCMTRITTILNAIEATLHSKAGN